MLNWLGGSGARVHKPDSKGLIASASWLGALLAAVTIVLPAHSLAAEPAQNSNSQLLRGPVLPDKITDKVALAGNIQLAALIHDNTTSDTVSRMDYSSFRFSFKPPAPKPINKKTRLRYASLGPIRLPKRKSRRRSHSSVHGLIKWRAYPGCVPRQLKKVMSVLADRFGNITVNSTHRSIRHNREVGGAKHSYHLRCQAVDFRIKRNYRAALAFLRKQPNVGGIKHYGGGRFHIDTGPRRTW